MLDVVGGDDFGRILMMEEMDFEGCNGIGDGRDEGDNGGSLGW